jgi:hypothetical protein
MNQHVKGAEDGGSRKREMRKIIRRKGRRKVENSKYRI